MTQKHVICPVCGGDKFDSNGGEVNHDLVYCCQGCGEHIDIAACDSCGDYLPTDSLASEEPRRCRRCEEEDSA